MSEYNLTYSQLKEKADLIKNSPSDATIHRWIQFCHIPRKELNRGYLYSNESIEKLKLCKKLSGFGRTINEMNLLYDNYSLDYLKRKLERISSEELANLVNKAKKRNK